MDATLKEKFRDLGHRYSNLQIRYNDIIEQPVVSIEAETRYR